MHRLPFKAEAEEDLAAIGTELAQRVGCHECHGSATERRTNGQYAQRLATAMKRQHYAKKRETGGKRPRDDGAHRGENEEHGSDSPCEAGISLVSSTPWHLILTEQHWHLLRW